MTTKTTKRSGYSIEYIIESQRRIMTAWSEAAGEDVEITFGDGWITALGSELATLRLFKYYAKDLRKKTQGFSINLNKHYFTLEL